MRTAFINDLVAQARLHPRIFLVVGDLGYAVIEPFAKEFPNRFLNAGVAEQNMAGVAAGLASEGWHVFTYSIANFPTFRCAEQIRNDIAYHNLSVTTVSVGGGLAYGSLGYSHHAIQDYALLRLFPNMVIAAPGDPLETSVCLETLVQYPGPSYLRLGKAGEPLVHAEKPALVKGVPTPLAPFRKKLLLTTGAALKLASDTLAANPSLAAEWQLCSLPLWSEETKPLLADALKNHDAIVTVEDHLLAGGFGGYINETLQLAGIRVPICNIALSEKVCGQVAGQPHLNEIGGLSASNICKTLKKF